MINIKNYTGSIKPVLQLVKKEGDIAVATDTFRLAEIKIPEEYTEVIPDGYYQPSDWGKITTEINKKNTKIDKLVELTSFHKKLDTEDYPDYKQILPKDDQLKEVDWNAIRVNTNFLSELILSIKGKFNEVSLADIKLAHNNQLVYKTDEVTILIMLMMK